MVLAGSTIAQVQIAGRPSSKHMRVRYAERAIAWDAGADRFAYIDQCGTGPASSEGPDLERPLPRTPRGRVLINGWPVSTVGRRSRGDRAQPSCLPRSWPR